HLGSSRRAPLRCRLTRDSSPNYLGHRLAWQRTRPISVTLVRDGTLTPIVVTIMALTTLGEAPEGRRPVLLTTDCGASVDDQWALVHLALSPEVEFKGVVTTHAPNLGADAAETTAKAARELLGRVAAKGAPPVLAGSSVPLADTAHP